MSPKLSETPKYHDFREKPSFACNNIETNVCVTSKTILLTDWVDLDSLFAAQLREIARVLGSQGAPADPSIDTALSASLYPGNIEWFSLIFQGFRDFFGILRN